MFCSISGEPHPAELLAGAAGRLQSVLSTGHIGGSLARQLGERDTLNPCQYYTKDGDAIFDQLTSLAEESNMALVLYFSPIHPTFQAEYLDESADYKWCKRIFDEVVAEAAASPNVYYLD